MSYIDPAEIEVGEFVDETDWNVLVDDIKYLKGGDGTVDLGAAVVNAGVVTSSDGTSRMRVHRHPYASNRHIESGTVSFANVSATPSASFTDAFSSAPVVTCTGLSGATAYPTSISTTGVTFGASTWASTSGTSYWMAEGAD